LPSTWACLKQNANGRAMNGPGLAK
jgi:hypothetical protein